MKRELFLNEEQRKIVEVKPNGKMLIKGVAGSGKTTVGVFKMYNLSRFFCKEDDKILCLTYNKVLANKMENLFHEVSELKQSQSLFDLPRSTENAVEIHNIDQVTVRLYNDFYNRFPHCARNSEERDFMLKAIENVKKEYPKVDIIDKENIEFLHEEIVWMMACGYTELEVYQNVDRTGRNGRHFSTTISPESTKEGASSDSAPAKKITRLSKNSIVRRSILRLLHEYYILLDRAGKTDFDAVTSLVLKKIKRQKELIKRAKDKGISIEQMLNSPDLKNSDRRILKAPVRRFKHIIIDEVQDFSGNQLRLVKELYDDSDENSSLILMGDTAQSIYSNSWMNHSNSFKMVGMDMSGRSRTLSKNHRNTYEIANAAASLISSDDEITGNNEYVEPETLERHGDKPVLRFYEEDETRSVGQNLLCRMIKNLHGDINENSLIKDYNGEERRFAYGQIGVIARNWTILSMLRAKLISQNIPSKIIDRNSRKKELSEDCVNLLTFHSAKGLEYSVVFIVGLSNGLFPYINIMNEESIENQRSRERRLLYVSMTRAVDNLFLLAPSVNPTSFLHEIDKNAIEIEGGYSSNEQQENKMEMPHDGMLNLLNKGLRKLNIIKTEEGEGSPGGFNSGRFVSSLGKLYQVNIENYRFKGKLDKIYSEEEIVRQWVIDVLVKKLGVPENMIDVEYKLRKFSASGRADIVVFADIEGKKQPVLLCETKSVELDTEESFNKAAWQLKQYADLCDTVKYTLLTNGKDTFEYRVVGNQWLEYPLPHYEDMIPQRMKVKSLRSDNEITICRPCRCEHNFTIINSSKQMKESSKVIDLPMLGRISAGPLKETYSETLKFTLPDILFSDSEVNNNCFDKNPKDYFVLEVDGNSMIEAGIEPKDLVLVRKTNKASYRDIIIALVEGEATMKRLIQLDGKVVLLPENKTMQPIEVEPQKLRVNGIVEAVIKQKGF